MSRPPKPRPRKWASRDQKGRTAIRHYLIPRTRGGLCFTRPIQCSPGCAARTGVWVGCPAFPAQAGCWRRSRRLWASSHLRSRWGRRSIAHDPRSWRAASHSELRCVSVPGCISPHTGPPSGARIPSTRQPRDAQTRPTRIDANARFCRFRRLTDG